MDDDRPGEAKEIADQARALIKNKNYAQALSLCEEAETDGLRSGELYAVHAIALTELKRYPEASTLINEMLQDYPNEPSLYYVQAFLKLRQKKPKDALAICDYATSIGVWNSKLSTYKSSALLNLGRYKEAFPYIISELEKYPDEPVLHYNLGTLYRRLNKKAESKQEYETAIALDPMLGEFKEKSSKRIKARYVFLYISIIYLIIGDLFFPDFRYALVPFCLAGIALWIFGLYLRLRMQCYKMALMSLLAIMSLSAIALFATFYQIDSSDSFITRFVTLVFILYILGIILLVRRSRRK